MRKLTVTIMLSSVLLGMGISSGIAATDVPGDSASAATPDNTSEEAMPPEPGSASDTNTGTGGNPGTEIGSTPPDEIEPTKDITAKSATGKSGKTDSKGASKAKSEFWGKYFGGKFGVINSSAQGTTSAPSASTLSYGVQGGYIQGGYNWDLSVFVIGMGAYIDWNNYTVHRNNIAYASRSYGLDAKLGFPVEEWLPYVKFGYGYSTGTRDVNLRAVSQNSPNVAIGVEYNVAPRWSLIAEFKRDSFTNRDKSITISNKLFSFGFNYYMDKPLEEAMKKEVEVDLPIPEPILDPNALPEAPPTP